MCGITAYCGHDKALPFLMQGLAKLEYRGYDSAGVATLEKNGLLTLKCQGKLKNLEALVQNEDVQGHIGIGHTRWATHGVPSQINSHPHCNHEKTISIVHNGIIENYLELKEDLIKKGYHFQSDTDSEVIVQLLDYEYHGDLKTALQNVLKKIKGSYALCVISTYEPDKILVAKKDSPLIIGKTHQACLVASDIPALLEYTREVYFLNDYEMAVLSADDVCFYNQDGQSIQKESTIIPFDLESAKKDGFETFMLKEIYEQPHAIQETMRGHIVQQHIVFNELKDIDFGRFHQIYYVACGTAYHAAMCGSQILQQHLQIPITTMVASEFRYSNPLIDEKTLAIFVSQSGETADTLAALRLAKNKNATTLALTNVLGSTISRDAHFVLYTCAGPEIAVASTKAYTTQLILLILFAYYVVQQLNHTVDEELLKNLIFIPQYIEDILKNTNSFQDYAKMISPLHDVYFIGRNLDYASVLEGALKLKEVSYIHADAYIAGELKHGPIALIEKGSVVIAVATQPHIAEKTISNIQETIARGAKVILLTTSHEMIKDIKDVYVLPDVPPILYPILVSIPLQLIAYYTAQYKQCNVDQPRNLAKSVTVE